MKKEELLWVLDRWFDSCNPTQRNRQTYKEIKEMIQSQGKVTEEEVEESASNARDAYGGYREDK